MRPILACAVLVVVSAAVNQAQAPAPEVIRIDPRANAVPFPHTWDRMFGSGRAILSLRESW